MTPREIILANLDHAAPERVGLCFEDGRRSDMVIVWAGEPQGYRQKRWREGNREYYDDKWGNIWVRMMEGPIKGEIFRPAIEEWSRLKDFSAPRYDIDRNRQAARGRLCRG